MRFDKLCNLGKKFSTNSNNHILLTVFLAGVILFIRKPDSLINPQFWAEDGTVFFAQQFNNGASAIVMPYAGYLHFLPRMIAFLVDLGSFPYAWVPAIYNYLSLVIALLVVASVFSPRFKINNKPLIALAIVLVPHNLNEVFLTVTNLQWIVFFIMVVVLFKENPSSNYGGISIQYVVDLSMIVIGGLTGPFIIFLVPFFALKWFQKRAFYNMVIFIVVVIVATVQFSFVVSETQFTQELNINLRLFSQILQLLGSKYFGTLFLGDQLAYMLPGYFLGFLYFVFLSILVYWSYQSKSWSNFTFIGISLVMLLITIFKFRNYLQILIPPLNGVRYFYIPSVMLIWSLINLLRERTKWIVILLTMIMFASFTSGFRSKPLEDYRWASYSTIIGKEDVLIPINPKGWNVHLESHP